MEITHEDQTYEIVKPTPKQLIDGQIVASKAFNEARLNKCVLRDALDAYLRTEGVWDDEKQEALEKLNTELDEIIVELKKGQDGKYKKMSEARKAAVRARQIRYAQTILLSESRKLDGYTAESRAEQARFDYLASVCIKRDGKPLFVSLDHYLENSGEDWAKKCASELFYLVNPGIDRDWENKFPENRFLKKYNLINENGSLVNKDGHLVDEEFRLIDDEGNFIDEEGNKVNIDGERIDTDGDVIYKDYKAFENDLE